LQTRESTTLHFKQHGKVGPRRPAYFSVETIYPVKRAQLRETSSTRSKVSCRYFLNRCAVEENEEDFETNWDLVVNKFDDMGLKEPVLRGIYGYGFKEPSPIQQKGILPVIQGKDTIA
jgi:hypothetical protein